ncbi:MAG: glycosyltransferase [Alphaproteobacteria bacterium]|nr:glycosyltransferase [Alphaproteobacteria bacterium]
MVKPANTPCLVIFCKRPRLFHGKQRLAKTIGAAQALIFARALLDCALEDAADWPGPLVLSPASARDRDWAKGLLARECQIVAQPDGGLGHRIEAIDGQLRGHGHTRIIFIGSDAPALRSSHFDQARLALATSDIVLGPAADGGVTLMGAAVPWPDLTRLPWSTDRLGTALAQCCHHHGLRLSHIAPGYDIDVAADLVRLSRDMAADPRPARRALYRELKAFFNQNELRYG